MNKLLSLSFLILALQASSAAYAIDDCSKGKIDAEVNACAEKKELRPRLI